MSRGKSRSFSGSFLQNQEHTKDSLGRSWGTDTGHTDKRERVSASPFPSVMLSSLQTQIPTGAQSAAWPSLSQPRRGPGWEAALAQTLPCTQGRAGAAEHRKAPRGSRTSWFSFATLDTELSVGGEGQPLGESVQTLSSLGEG